MKQKILELLKERHEINITDFHTLIPESKGEYAMYMPVRSGLNPNILWMSRVSQDFIKVFNELMIEEGLIEWKPSNILRFMLDGSPIYSSIRLCKTRYIKKETECWLPIVIILNK